MALRGAPPSLFADRRLGRLIAGHLTFTRLEDAALPAHLVAAIFSAAKKLFVP